MIQEKKILAIIPARGGSKGVPRKNIREVGGKPLIAWTIAEAKKSRYIDRLIVSTEDEQIISVAKEWGCEAPFVRPQTLAQDDTPGVDPVLHALEALPGYNYVLLLQPTSPLRTVEDIDGCIEHLINGNANVCVSVTQAQESPYWMYTLDSKGRMQSLLSGNRPPPRRQDLPKVYVLNGALYIAEVSWFQTHRTFLTAQTLAYPMPSERSLDIDTEWDFKFFTCLAQERI